MNAEVKQLFKILCNRTKENFTLDHLDCYGGYIIEKPEKEGGISHPFGSSRRRKLEMCAFIQGLIEGIYYSRGESK